MKLLPILLFVLLSCTTKETEFITISPEPGAISMQSESGAFGQSWTIETYFISMIQEDDIKIKHGFIVLKLKRTFKDENKAYKILDLYNKVDRAGCIDESWLTDERKNEIIETRKLARQVNTDLREHVRINIEPEALITGISENGFLTYESN